MASVTHRPKRLSPWTIFWAVMALVGLLALSPVMIFWIWSNGQARRVNELTAEIRAKGEPLTGEELSNSLSLEANQVDVTKLWLEGIVALSTPENELASKELPFVGIGEEKPLPKLGEPWPELDACAAYINANLFAFDKFHEAARLGGHARFATDYSQGIAMALPAVQNIRLAARALRLELEVRAQQGNARGAADAIRSLLVLHRSMERDPTVVSHLVRIAIDGVGIRALSDKLCLLPFTNEELREFQRLVQTNLPEKGLRNAFVGERALGYSMLLNPQLMGDERPGMAPLNGDRATYLIMMNNNIDAIEQGFPECFAAYEIAEREIAARCKSWAARWTAVYTMFLMSDVYSTLHATARDIAALRALDAGIAAELYRRDTGSLPENLAQLAPKYLTAAPTDPYTGDPLFFKKTPEGFTIYAVGKNKIDDGGVFGVGKNTDEGLFFPLK